MTSILRRLAELGIAHNDVRPANILRVRGIEWILIDFGCAVMRPEEQKQNRNYFRFITDLLELLKVMNQLLHGEEESVEKSGEKCSAPEGELLKATIFMAVEALQNKDLQQAYSLLEA